MNELIYEGKYLYIPDRYFHENLKSRFVRKTYEIEESVMIKNYFDKNDDVLEIGSCLGYTTCLLSDNCKSVVSVEANPELSEGLSLCKEKNNLNNVTFINGYLDEIKKTIKFQTYDNVVAGSGDREDLTMNNVGGWGGSLKMYDVETITLDELLKYNNFNSMMIDMEGGELKFIQQNIDFIEKNINKICIELHGFMMKDKDFNTKCINVLKQAGFRLIKQNVITYYFEK